MLLTPALLARETNRLLAYQMRDDDPPFISSWQTRLHREALKWRIDDFSIEYLAEAADTMVHFNEPLWPIHQWPYFELPPQVQAGRSTGKGVTVRVCLDYNLYWDSQRMQIDVVWNANR